MRPFVDGASVRRPRGSCGVIPRSRAIYSSSRCNEVYHCIMMLLGCCKDSSFFFPLSSRCFQITVCLWFIQDFYSSVRSKHPPKLESGHLWWVLERPHQSRSYFFRNCSWIEVEIKERKGLKSVLACCHVKSRGWRGNISQQTVLTRQTIQGCVCVCRNLNPLPNALQGVQGVLSYFHHVHPPAALKVDI